MRRLRAKRAALVAPFPVLVAGLVTALAAFAGVSASAAPAPPKVNFSLYQELLNDHLWTTSQKGEPLETRFNYEKFYDERGRAERTFRIRRQFLGVDPEKLDLKSRRAWAINFYNFIVLEQITDHLLMPGKVRQRFLTVKEIQPEGLDFFARTVVKIDTTNYSLDQFEHHFLFMDFDRKPGNPRPAGFDPRIHFAIVCGAIGCPPLLPRAYRPDSLELQLNRAVRESLASPRHLVWTPDVNAVRLSAIFSWYLPDFGGIREAVQWALGYAPKETRASFAKSKRTPAMGQIIWDWKINQIVGWRFYDQMATPIPGARVPHDTS